MTGIILTQYNGKIIGPIAKLLGYLMNAIFEFLNMIKIPNIGLSIIILQLSFICYKCRLPLNSRSFQSFLPK